MTLAQLLTRTLEAQRMTPLQFCARMEQAGAPVTLQSVNYWLSGERLPRAEFASTICSVLKIEPATFLDACAPRPDKDAA